MKTIRPLLAALALAFALFPFTLRAAIPTPEARVDRLNQLVTLTSPQQAQAFDIFRNEDAAIAAQAKDARQLARDSVRAILTPAQQRIYDRAPQMRGGGLTLGLPENRLATLEKQAGGLSAAQKKVALQVYEEEFEALVAIPPADRMQQGTTARQTARDAINRILTPAQQARIAGDRADEQAKAAVDRAAVEEILRASRSVAARVGAVQKILPGNRSSIAGVDGARTSGSFELQVTGANRTETMTAYWERKPETAPLRVTRIEPADGGSFAP